MTLKKVVSLLRIILLFLLSSLPMLAHDALTTDVMVFEDSSAVMQVNDVMKQGVFIPYDRKIHDYSGVTQSVFWVKVTLINRGTTDKKMVYSFTNNLFLANVEVYSGDGTLLKQFGRDFSFDSYYYPFCFVGIPMQVSPNSTATYYLKVYSQHAKKLGYHIREEREYIAFSSQMQSFFAFYYGGILVLIVYNFIFFTYSRRIEFFYYALFALSMLRIMIVKNGIGTQYLWPNHPEFNALFVFEACLTLGIFGLLFTREFFKTLQYTPRLDTFLRFFIYIDIALIVFIQFDSVRHTDLLAGAVIGMVLSLLIMIASASYLYLIVRNRAALILLSGWGILIIGSSTSLIASYNLIEYNFITSNISQLASFLELLIFSLALAYSYKESHENLQKKELEITSINQNLQKIVHEQTQELQSEVQYKENLLKELSHRVKNSLQVVASFISLQTKHCDNAWVKSLLADSTLRILAMSSIHERLVHQDSADYVDMQRYFETLIDENRRIYAPLGFESDVNTHGERLLIDQATTVGLIVNEMISNALKHAFKETKDPKIQIVLKQLDTSRLELKVYDNGCGINSEHQDKRTSLGRKIIASLADQLQAEIEIISDKGCGYILRFKRSRS